VKILYIKAVGIDLRVTLADGSLKWFCGEAIDEFHKFMGGFGNHTGKDFDSDKFLEFSSNYLTANLK